MQLLSRLTPQVSCAEFWLKPACHELDLATAHGVERPDSLGIGFNEICEFVEYGCSLARRCCGPCGKGCSSSGDGCINVLLARNMHIVCDERVVGGIVDFQSFRRLGSYILEAA